MQDVNVSDEEAPVHDQLPSVEAAKANLEHKPAGGISSLKWTICAGVAFVVTVIAITLLAVLVPKMKENAPTSSRQEEVISLLVQNGVTPESTLRNPTSPQGRAALFIADGDAYKTSITAETGIIHKKFVQRYALAVIYYHFTGEMWNNRLNFMTSQDQCNWFQLFSADGGVTIFRKGVTCNDQGDVTTLMLPSNNLIGNNFPDEIRWLTQLDTFLFYFNNKITGDFPRGLQELPYLKNVGLQYCSLSGEIPVWIGDLTGLTTLYLGDNKFAGQVPTSISSLTNLKLLSLDNSAGLTGNVQIFKSMTQLEILYLEGNTFTGNLNGMLENMPKLVELDISDNFLTGEVPTAVLQHNTLTVADLNGNFFTNELPNDIFTNIKLEYLALHNNNLSGIIPIGFAFIASLRHLDLSFNAFVGPIPDAALGSMIELRYLATSGNNFTAQTMQDMKFSTLVNLRELAMKDNNLKGTIPTWIAEFISLQLLDLDANQLTGQIPTWIGVLQGLDHLLLNRNELTGTLPSEMGTLKDLDVLLLDGNSFFGSAEAFCDKVKPEYFVSDCYPGIDDPTPAPGSIEIPEIECPCCTMCCKDDDIDCNNKYWTSNADPKWEYGYVRSRYTFNLTDAPVEYAATEADDLVATDAPVVTDPPVATDPLV